MIGRVLDYVVLHTVKDGHKRYSGEQTVTDFDIAHWVKYSYKPLKTQPVFEYILDVGAFDVNGSFSDYNFFGRDKPWREIVGNKSYMGIDLAEGRGVDKVMNAHEMSFEDNSFDLVICLEMLEHDDQPAQSIKEMYRVLKPNHLLILSCPDDVSPEHHQGVSDHYTRISPAMLRGWLTDAGFKIIDNPKLNPGEHNLVTARKPK